MGGRGGVAHIGQVEREGSGRGRGCVRDAALFCKIKLLFLDSRLIIIIPRSRSYKFNKLKLIHKKVISNI